jgi:hypothetical protein
MIRISTDFDSSFFEILLAHERRYPLWQVQDLYKLAHQAALGSEHAVLSPEFAKRALEVEIQCTSAGNDEPLVDPLSGDGEIVRIHLRPFLNAGLLVPKLLDAFLLTAANFIGSIEMLQLYLTQAKKLASEKQIAMDVTDLAKFEVTMRGKGFPAVHHSELFKKNYQPAYRVVARNYLRSTGIIGPETR